MSFLSFLVESYLVFLVPVSRPPAAGHWELSSRRSLDLWGYLFFKLSGTCFLNLGICSWFSSLGVTSGSGWSNFLRLSEDRKWMPVELFLRDPGVKEEKRNSPLCSKGYWVWVCLLGLSYGGMLKDDFLKVRSSPTNERHLFWYGFSLSISFGVH